LPVCPPPISTSPRCMLSPSSGPLRPGDVILIKATRRAWCVADALPPAARAWEG
jgi:hypothetical protein